MRNQLRCPPDDANPRQRVCYYTHARQGRVDAWKCTVNSMDPLRFWSSTKSMVQSMDDRLESYRQSPSTYSIAGKRCIEPMNSDNNTSN